jgi:radical SAM superfamily enzyme YgiQ (UPF0313 family)
MVGITGKVTQYRRMIGLAQQFRERRKLIVIGGPLASLSPELVRSHCDVLVRGEIEEIAPQLFADLRAGTWKKDYLGTKCDLAAAPVPLWEKYPNDRAISGTVQTSRGCPFECEFCDVIQYLGRKQRHKPIAHVLAELDTLYRHGYRSIFIADDNFTVYRSRAKELLSALSAWNRGRSEGPVRFITQVSIDASRDEELLAMCAEAGLRQVFIGIETPNAESLRESKKRQNLMGNLSEQVASFVAHGITVYGGMIVGFDHDGPDIFARQYEFAMSMPVPIFTIGALVAPAATPLHDRLLRAGRLVEGPEVAAMPWSTNVVPAKMSRETLLEGLSWLCSELYAPAHFSERIDRLLDGLRNRLPTEGHLSRSSEHVGLYQDLKMLVTQLPGMGDAESALLQHVLSRLGQQPEARYYVFPHLIQYMQIRHMFQHGGIWQAEHS